VIPPEFQEALKGVSAFEFVAVLAVSIVAVWVVVKGLVWLFKKFFPGVVASATAVVNGAKIFAAVNGLPEFMASTTATLAQQNVEQLSLATQVKDIHHEVHFNNGTSLKDAAARTEARMQRVEVHLGIEQPEVNP
jgi:hypothetical protein